jgi:hypothetical protein
MDLLSYSDIAASLSGALFAEVHGTVGNTQMVVIRSLIVSIIARMASKNASLANTIPVLNESAKNQLCVAVLNGIYAYYKKQSLIKTVLTGVSIDLIGAEVLRTLKLDDTVIFSTTAAPVKT